MVQIFGLYKYAEKSVYSYQIGEVKVLETHALAASTCPTPENWQKLQTAGFSYTRKDSAQPAA